MENWYLWGKAALKKRFGVVKRKFLPSYSDGRLLTDILETVSILSCNTRTMKMFEPLTS
ncbi:hypothetical protein ALT785_850073 [Alteromonas infernus]